MDFGGGDVSIFIPTPFRGWNEEIIYNKKIDTNTNRLSIGDKQKYYTEKRNLFIFLF